MTDSVSGSVSVSGMNDPSEADTSTASAAADEAKGVAQTAASSAGAVGSTAKDEAVNIAHEAKYQTKDLLHQGRRELLDQATAQQERAARGLRSVHEELSSMAEKSEDPGVATDLVRQAAHRARTFAEYLEARDPGSLLEEAKSFARRRPGAFLAIAAGAGLLAGRLTRSLAAGAPEGQDQQPPGATGDQGALGTHPAPAGHGLSSGTAYPVPYQGTGTAPDVPGLGPQTVLAGEQGAGAATEGLPLVPPRTDRP